MLLSDKIQTQIPLVTEIAIIDTVFIPQDFKHSAYLFTQS